MAVCLEITYFSLVRTTLLNCVVLSFILNRLREQDLCDTYGALMECNNRQRK